MTHALEPVSNSVEGRQIAQQLTAAEGRLVDFYAREGVITEEHVRATFGHVAQRFIDARVRTFLPILIERAVRRELAG